ncbi:MAG: 50S ribosomal protein L31 [Candidatus Bipolaricaulis sp.]|nr:50S ribosomal protein L31 [Candidatus Bipolaricaulis sp.]MDD5220223.1 50S ribosomal protein L31 [Candidatus Bipolaricaulis sp.]MDD5647154.1 50S ribosomal protein L31 [Candidatus Bipolaricaulis sp.]
MKQGIHPEMKKAVVHCGCGAELETLSTVQEMRVDICSKCHPFYTGEERFVDTEGRVERFQRKYAARPTSTKKKAEK